MRSVAPFLPSLFCLLAAVTIILVRGGGSEGWGWLLFFAFLFYPDGEPTDE